MARPASGGGGGPVLIGPRSRMLAALKEVCHAAGLEARDIGGRRRRGRLEGPASEPGGRRPGRGLGTRRPSRSEEHTSKIQSQMRISYDVLCLKKKKQHEK